MSFKSRSFTGVANDSQSSEQLIRQKRDEFIASQNKFGFGNEVFGVPLEKSIDVAESLISVPSEDPGDFIRYGRIPLLVGKCGSFLKEKGLGVEGIFRVTGSSRRVKELQYIFSTPPEYGRKLSWDGYTVHDAASLFRRFLNNLPEPLVPLDLYEQFREPVRSRPRIIEHRIAKDLRSALKEYRVLIDKLPLEQKHLLYYLLDLLTMFADNAKKNLMPARNLAAIFQPSILSHPDHDLNPDEYALSQAVVEVLIEYSKRLLPDVNKRPSEPPTTRNSSTNLLSVPQSASGSRPHSRSLSAANVIPDVINPTTLTTHINHSESNLSKHSGGENTTDEDIEAPTNTIKSSPIDIPQINVSTLNPNSNSETVKPVTSPRAVHMTSIESRDSRWKSGSDLETPSGNKRDSWFKRLRSPSRGIKD
ncbi:RhoGAP-domain-containing protein [Cyberlindnera jadinii NRRL Y-1542]|uniref:RhoGAP-domain-containing protein n=1 Tax=Cyberlindnera jadinii (strain ATCC 18201 / CBS 1600 / BCRC 20928 / JCM 3617 / NBRC 0987 / NRRL Y-1542) TaxID=983966 RepID=A0A1E4RZP1_CYBJN|nr:RhoGAP-domain-containing protein [Cyberlindnera jadinii NRRL Y-1542]ODV72635.1 RhoGAP-domain-containing protein [Cyberlindnera jadinii NRRL Y-1542]